MSPDYVIVRRTVDLVERGATVLHRRSATSVFRVEHGPEATTLHLADFSTLTIPRGHRVPVVELRKELVTAKGKVTTARLHEGSRIQVRLADGYRASPTRPPTRSRTPTPSSSRRSSTRRRRRRASPDLQHHRHDRRQDLLHPTSDRSPDVLDRTASEGGPHERLRRSYHSSSTKETVALHPRRLRRHRARPRAPRLEPPSLRGHRPRSSRGRRHR